MALPNPKLSKHSEKLATKSSDMPASNARENKPPRRTRTESSSRSSGRACSRPRRRTTDVIEVQTVSEMMAAMIHAEHVGLLPNRMMTVNLEAGGVEDPIGAIRNLMKLMRDALRRKGPVAYIWVRETGPVVGDHVHILLHLPPMRKGWFGRRKVRWLKQCGIQKGDGISHTAHVRGAPTGLDVEVTSPELYSANLRNLIAYLSKHCSIDVQRDLGIVSEGPCPVVGKRVSISENLHRKARSTCPHCADG